MNNPTSNPNYDDEIDLFELAQELWREKLLIIAVTVLVSLAAVVYVSMVPSIYTYSNKLTVQTASLHQYGQLAAAMPAEGKQGLQVANELATANFALLQKNIDSKLMQNKFKQITTHAENVSFAVTVPKGARGVFELSATDSNDQNLAEALESYLLFAAEKTTEELNSFLSGLGVEQRVSPEMLYSSEPASPNNSVTVKPKKKLIVAVGVVLGGMLGIFAALLRSAIRKRKQAASE